MISPRFLPGDQVIVRSYDAHFSSVPAAAQPRISGPADELLDSGDMGLVLREVTMKTPNATYGATVQLLVKGRLWWVESGYLGPAL